MDGRQFTIALFRETPPPSVLRLEESISVYPATLTRKGELRCEGFAVLGLAEIDTLCLLMTRAGLPDGAMQVRTHRGEPVCFVASVHQLGTPPTPAPVPNQYEMELASQ